MLCAEQKKRLENGKLTPQQEAAVRGQLAHSDAPGTHSDAPGRDLDGRIEALAQQLAGLRREKHAQQPAEGSSKLDAAAMEWLESCGLSQLSSTLGAVGSTLADLAMMRAEDVDALQLKTLTRRRLRAHLARLEGSLCVAAPHAAVEGQQLRAAIEQQLSFGSIE